LFEADLLGASTEQCEKCEMDTGKVGRWMREVYDRRLESSAMQRATRVVKMKKLVIIPAEMEEMGEER
jgi:hypothetical protein